MHKKSPMNVFSAQNHNCFHFPIPMERYFTRRAGPPTTAWRGRERHAEDDFLVLVRYNAATKLEMEWPPVAKKRRVGKPNLDEQYSRALCDWVATLEEPPETLPQTKRPGWWRQGMSLFDGGAPPHAAEADATLELEKPKRAYHQPSRELRNWVVDYAQLRLLQGWDHQTIAQHLSAWLPHVFRPWLSTRTVRRWLQDNKKAGRQPRDACDVLIPILRETCDRVGEAGVPISARVMQPVFNRVAEQHGFARRFGRQWTVATFPSLCRLQVSHRIRRHQENDGSHAGGRAH